MSWHDSVWTRRALISVDNTAGAASADIDVDIPVEWDDFWNVIDETGLELRAVSYNSNGVLAYTVDGGAGVATFSAASREGRVRIDAAVLPAVANSTVALWLYYGSTSTQGTGASTAGVGGTNGYIEIGQPGMHRFGHQPQAPRRTQPRFTLHKRVNEEVFVWVDIGGILQARPTPARSALFFEEAYYVTPQVLNTSGVDQTSMWDSSRNRLVQIGRRTWFKMLVKAGTTDTNYTANADVRTILPSSPTATPAVHQRIQSVYGVNVFDTYHTT